MFNYIINFKTVFSCFISAIGYGLGFYIPYYFNLPMWLCIVICIAVGLIFDFLGEKAVDLKIFEGKPYRELIVGLIIYGIYVAAWYLTKGLFDHDLDEDLYDTFLWMVGIQFVGWAINLIKQYIKAKKKMNKDKKQEKA